MKSKIAKTYEVTSIFSIGNHKLGKNIAIFNLPAALTCPGATELCSNICYAFKAENLYPKTLVFRNKMFTLSMRNDFVDIINKEIAKLPNYVKYIRIHESGDFYNQEYVDKWIKIAKANPKLRFYAYTKSYMFDFSQRPDNMVIKLSLDSTSPQEAIGASGRFDGEAWMIEHGTEPIGHLCPMDCRKCNYCMVSKGDVSFEIH